VNTRHSGIGLPTNSSSATEHSATEQERKEIELLLAPIIRPILPVLSGADADGRLLRYRAGSGRKQIKEVVQPVRGKPAVPAPEAIDPASRELDGAEPRRQNR
jgi:hypothetical protein